MKDFDDINPKNNDVKWRDSVKFAQLAKTDTWYQYRIIGGVYSVACHWVKYKTNKGKEITFPVDCLAYSNDLERVDDSKVHLCPGCQAGIKHSIKYMFNVIDRDLQNNGQKDFIRGFELPPGAMRKVSDLKKLNTVRTPEGIKPYTVAHPEYGCDLYIQKIQVPGKQGTDWQFQKGDRCSLTDQEKASELYNFEEIYVPGDANSARQSLIRAGYFGTGGNAEGTQGVGASLNQGAMLPPGAVGQMPPSGQVPSSQKTIGFQVETADNATNPPNVTEQSSNIVSSGLGKLPNSLPMAASQSTDKPDCFGAYMGKVICVKCPHRNECLEISAGS